MRYWLAFLIVSVTLSCNEDVEVKSLEGQWRFVHYYNLETKLSQSAPVDLARSITLNFVESGVSGTFHGHTLSHSIEGTFERPAANRIHFSHFDQITTEEDYLSRLVRLGIENTDAYKRSDYSLNLYFNQGKEVLIFVKL